MKLFPTPVGFNFLRMGINALGMMVTNSLDQETRALGRGILC